MAYFEDRTAGGIGPPMRPSEHVRGRLWVANFDSADQSAAALLIDSLRIVSSAEMRGALRDRVKTLAESQVRTPAVVIPVLGRDDLPAPGGREPHIAYTTFTPGAPISSTPGSEGLVGNLLRDLTGGTPGREPGQLLHPATTLEGLRDKRCRTIIVLTDYCGSGMQVSEYVKMLTKNKTVRSWRSYGLVEFVVVSYAMSLRARERIRSENGVEGLFTEEIAADFWNAQWTVRERQSVIGICNTYRMRSSPWKPLGFDNSAGLYASDMQVPNNLPAILLQTDKGWNPFFEGRVVPSDIVTESSGYQADWSRIQSALDAGQLRAARAMERNPNIATLGLPQDILIALSRRRLDDWELSSCLHASLHQVHVALRFLTGLGLIADDKLTAKGRAELVALRRFERKTSGKLSPSDEPYYPQKLR
jgi:hypothetical protein